MWMCPSAALAHPIRDRVLSSHHQITMSMANDDNEVSLKLQRLKKWMKEKRLPRGFQQTAMGAKNRTFF